MVAAVKKFVVGMRDNWIFCSFVCSAFILSSFSLMYGGLGVRVFGWVFYGYGFMLIGFCWQSIVTFNKNLWSIWKIYSAWSYPSLLLVFWHIILFPWSTYSVISLRSLSHNTKIHDALAILCSSCSNIFCVWCIHSVIVVVQVTGHHTTLTPPSGTP